MNDINRIEIHYIEDRNHKVRIEYRIFLDPVMYRSKTRSELTKRELEIIKNGGAERIYHF